MELIEWHFRDETCQKFTPNERFELERFISKFENEHPYKFVYCSTCEVWYKNFAAGIYFDFRSMKEISLDDNHTYHNVVCNLDNRA